MNKIKFVTSNVNVFFKYDFAFTHNLNISLYK